MGWMAEELSSWGYANEVWCYWLSLRKAVWKGEKKKQLTVLRTWNWEFLLQRIKNNFLLKLKVDVVRKVQNQAFKEAMDLFNLLNNQAGRNWQLLIILTIIFAWIKFLYKYVVYKRFFCEVERQIMTQVSLRNT